MKISVIIPVYNSSKYLKKCVESIRTQSYSNIEIILVDDGSSDGSEKICDQYTKIDERIKCIHQKNGGTSAARNTGLKHASGKYVMFMDNDDYWRDDKCIETIVKQLSQSDADVLTFGIITYWENKNKFSYPKTKCSRELIVGQKTEVALKRIIERGLLSCTVWSKIVKRSLILEKEIWFPEGKRNEDSEWIAHLMLCAKTYDWMEIPFYVYRKGHVEAQTSKPHTYRIVIDLKNIIIKFCNIIEQNEMQWTEEFKRAYLSYIAYLYSVWMAQTDMLNDERIKRDIQEMKPYVELLKYNLDPSVKIVGIVYKICGYRLTSKLLKLYMIKKYNIKA